MTVDEIARYCNDEFDDSEDDSDFEELTGEREGWVDDTSEEEDLPDIDIVARDHAEEDEDAGDYEPPRKRRLKDRAVHSIDTALDKANYNEYVAPIEKKEVVAVMEKGKRNQPDKVIKWRNYLPDRPRVGRAPAEQIRHVKTGSVIGDAKHADTPGKCFSLFLTDEILAEVVDLTNANIERVQLHLNPAQLQYWTKKKAYRKPLTIIELKAFFGLFYVRGLLKLNYSDKSMLWEDKIGHPIFAATMSEKRFSFICRFLIFDDPLTRRQRWKTDRFAAIRKIFEDWNNNCGKIVAMGDFGAVDENLYNSRQAITFKVYNPNKPHPYGINFKCLNEVRFAYTHRSEVYAGKPTEMEGAEYYIDNTFDITTRLFEKYGWD